MAKQIRSNSPLALSVASMTSPGNVQATVDRILEFDDARIGFTHDKTWNSLPVARRGVIKSDSDVVAPGTHPRVESCVRALCALGERDPVETRRFADYPASGLRPLNDIDWGPNVTLKVKGVCWFVRDGQATIPLLQPRKAPLSEGGLGLYGALARQAFCNGDWRRAAIELIDLSGEDEDVFAQVFYDKDIPRLSEEQIAQYVLTFVEAKLQVDVIRASRPKKPPKPKGPDLFDPKGT